MKERVSTAIFCLWMAATPAAAMQCARASTPLEKALCSDGQLAAADGAMAEAYFKLLHAIEDPSIRSSLIASQRRWLAARESELGALDQADGFHRRTQRSVLLAVTRQRTRDLQARKGTSRSSWRSRSDNGLRPAPTQAAPLPDTWRRANSSPTRTITARCPTAASAAMPISTATVSARKTKTSPVTRS